MLRAQGHARRPPPDTRRVHGACQRGLLSFRAALPVLCCGRWVVFRGLRTIPQDGRGGLFTRRRRTVLGGARRRGELRRGRSIIFPPCRASAGTFGRRAPWP